MRDCEGCTIYYPNTMCPIVNVDYCPCRNCLIKVVCKSACPEFSHLKTDKKSKRKTI